MNEWTKARKSSSGRLLGGIIYIHPSMIHPSFHLFIHPSSQPAICASLHPAIFTSFLLFIQLSIHPSILPPIYPSCHPFIYLFSYLCNTYLLSSYYMPSNVLGSGRTVRESLSLWDYTVCIQSRDYTESQPAGYIIANRSAFRYLSFTLFACSALAMLASLLSFKHTPSSVSVTLVFLSRHLFLQDLLANSLASFKFLHRFLLLSASYPDHSI